MQWDLLNTQIAAVTAFAAAACAVPGTFLFLRKESLLGDAISHTALLGIVGGFLVTSRLVAAEFIPAGSHEAWERALISLGAVLAGVATAVGAEWVAAKAKVDATAALGIAFTTAFALGLLLLEQFARDAHVDPEHVLFGQVELAADDTLGRSDVPRAAATSGVLLLLNALAAWAFLKELRLVSFDPTYAAASAGIGPRLIGRSLAAATAVTLVTVFEAVGSILPIAMLITPAAAARCWTDRLGRLLIVATGIGFATGILGHVAAIGVPALIGAIGSYERVPQPGTAGATALVGGLVFIASIFFGPRGRLSVWK